MNDNLEQKMSALHKDIIATVKNIETLIIPNANKNLSNSSEFDEIINLLNEINSYLENAIQQNMHQDTVHETFILDENEKVI